MSDAPRRTIDLETLVRKANQMLRDSKPEMVGQREGIASLLTDALLWANNYRGFSHIEVSQLFDDGYEGTLITRNGKHYFMTISGEKIEIDDSRRQYYFPR